VRENRGGAMVGWLPMGNFSGRPEYRSRPVLIRIGAA
jgi:hypothetical protein